MLEKLLSIWNYQYAKFCMFSIKFRIRCKMLSFKSKSKSLTNAVHFSVFILSKSLKSVRFLICNFHCFKMMLKKYLRSETVLIESWEASREKRLHNCKKQADLNSDNRKEICLLITRFSLCQDEIMKWYANINISELNCKADCCFRTTRLLMSLSKSVNYISTLIS